MSKGFKINIKNLHYAILEKDDETTIQYKDIVKIPGLMEITLTPNVIEGQLYGDGRIRDKESKQDSIGVGMNLNKLPLKNRAEMLGNEYENGILKENVDDIAPYLALGWEIETTTGKPELIWLLKGKLNPVTDDLKQREGGITYNTNNANFTFIPREHDGMFKEFADGNDEMIEQTVIDNWFKQVPGTVVAP